ncbi:MAG: hypothetical protein ISS28_01855 [Candidatus Cloacimonetes bacterium]|nr:hypothetical protein [Candidatus Cloacimonadota bacterium]
MYQQINEVLMDLEKKNPGFVDKLDDYEVNQIQEVKKILKGFKIVNFTVNHDNKTIRLAGSTKVNIGGNRLVGFNYTLIPNI